ncbi:hypothetical protein [Pseudomonas sp. zfem005]|uniref:hypothetical protein n=1 Tax=Pseudomonas sp. zfem005 TaxID=3078200 RepID=UPI00292A1CDE|nr:hypothetical protein [Pseudomonas sp. zfem005]MDU9416756.1 hypothetical protein [Pseudomonas sp. zfem005]
MPYVFEKMSSADWEKVLSDASCDPVKKVWLEINGFSNWERLFWVVDRHNDYYVFPCASGRDSSCGASFYVYLNGLIQEVYVDGLFGDLVEFRGGQLLVADKIRFSAFLKAALPVLGRYGVGADNELDKINPVFKDV